MGLNKDLIGKEYPPQEHEITVEESKKYAFGYNEELPLFTDESTPGGIVAPPMFAVKYAGTTIAQAFFDPELNADLGRLVHGEQDMEFMAPARPGDNITSVLKIVAIDQKSTGEIFTTETNSKNQDGIVVVRTSSTFFIRGKKSGGSPKNNPEEPPKRDYIFNQSMGVKEDQTYIYAEGSGDHNPIHVDPDFAVKVGLPGIILQGLCTMAFCFKAVQDNYAGKDPLRIRRLKVRFAKPVLPLDTVTTKGWVRKKKEGATVLGLEAENQRGDIVIKNGLAEVLDG